MYSQACILTVQQALLLPIVLNMYYAGVKWLVCILQITPYIIYHCVHKMLMTGLEYCFDSIFAKS